MFTHSASTSAVPERDIPIPDSDELRLILKDLERIAEIMTQDGETNFVGGMHVAIDHVKSALKSPTEAKGYFLRAADTYRSMWGGMGSLSEFYIANGSPEEQAKLSTEYDERVKRLDRQLKK